MIHIVKNLAPEVAADIALKSRLYVSGWMLSKTLKNVRKFKHADKILLAYDGEIPVGVALRFSGDYVQVFVKASYRRKGIGTKLVKSLKRSLGDIKGTYGVDGSLEFYKKLGVEAM